MTLRLLAFAAVFATTTALICALPTVVAAPRLGRAAPPQMQFWSDGKQGKRSRFEDGDDKRMSQRRVGASKMEKFGGTESSRIRQAKLEAYVYSEEDPTDGTIGKVIAGSFLITLFGLLAAVFMYYGGVDGLVATNGRSG